MQRITGTSLDLQFLWESYGFRCGMTFNLVQSPNLSPKVTKILMAIRSFSIYCGGCKYKYVVTAKRGPLRDADCYWDYGKACCAWQEYCEYRFSFLFHLKFHIYYSEICNFNYCETECRYSFGDVHLGQSCRLRNTSANMLLQYI